MSGTNEDQFISIEETLNSIATVNSWAVADAAKLLLKQGVAARLEYKDDGKPEKENTSRIVPYLRIPGDGMVYPAKDYLKNCDVMQDALESWANPDYDVSSREYAYGKFGWLRADLYKFLKSKGFETKCVEWLKPADAPAAKAGAVRGITKGAVINAFQGLYFDCDKWSKYLGDPPDWLKECRVSKGSKKASATWNPVLIAAALFDKQIQIRKLDAVFVDLKGWVDEWQEASASFRV